MAIVFVEDKRFKELKIGEGFIYVDGVECAVFDYIELIKDGGLKEFTPKGRTIRFVFVYDRREDGRIEVADETYDISTGMRDIIEAVKFKSTFDLRMITDRKLVPEAINLEKYI